MDEHCRVSKVEATEVAKAKSEAGKIGFMQSQEVNIGPVKSASGR